MADYVQKISSGYVYKFMSNSILATSEPKLTQCALGRRELMVSDSGETGTHGE